MATKNQTVPEPAKTVKHPFRIGPFTVIVTGPEGEELKFESRHNFLQFAVGDGQLREIHAPIAESAAAAPDLTQIISAVANAMRGAGGGVQTSAYPSNGEEATQHVLSDAAVIAATPGADTINPDDAAKVARHLRDVTASVGGF